MKARYEKVTAALRICCTQVTPAICKECPYGGQCVGDNVPLLNDALEVIEMLKRAAPPGLSK